MEYKINFNVICKVCGKHLKAEQNWRGNILVEPCPKCCDQKTKREEKTEDGRKQASYER